MKQTCLQDYDEMYEPHSLATMSDLHIYTSCLGQPSLEVTRMGIAMISKETLVCLLRRFAKLGALWLSRISNLSLWSLSPFRVKVAVTCWSHKSFNWLCITLWDTVQLSVVCSSTAI